MAGSRKQAEISLIADASGVKSGVDEAKRELGTLGDAAEDAGRRGGAGLSKLSLGADKAAKETGKATRSIVSDAKETASEVERSSKKADRAYQSWANSVVRNIALTKSGGSGTADYYRELASLRGIDIAGRGGNKLLDQLQAVQKQTVSNTISVKQYNAALRMVPAQMTDIVTQLAGGQNPFLIAIQQGGQLRDSFGGFGTMFKGIASAIGPVRLAMGGMLGVLGALGVAIYKGSEESREFRKTLILAGDAAGLSAGQLQNIAATVGSSTQQYGAAREAVLAFAQTGKVAASDYERFTESVVLQSQATGKSVDDLVQKYAEIANDPLRAVQQLSSAYQSMTADVYAQARALIDQGKEQEAVALIQRKYADESKEMASRVLSDLGYIERGWIAVQNAASSAWEGMKSIGREATLKEQADTIQKQLKDGGTYTAFGSGLYGGGSFVPFSDEEKRRKQAELTAVMEKSRIEAETAMFNRRRKEAEQDGIKSLDTIHKAYNGTLSRQVVLTKEITELQENLRKVRAVGSKETVAQAEKEVKAAIAAKRSEIASLNEREKKTADKKAKSSKEKEINQYLAPYSGRFSVTSGISGARKHPVLGTTRRHDGVDVAMPSGTVLKAMADGIVKGIKSDPKGYGRYLDIQHNDGTSARYAHLSAEKVKVGQRVKAGQAVALSGNSGLSSGAHLHMETRDEKGRLIDFRSLIGKKAKNATGALSGIDMSHYSELEKGGGKVRDLYGEELSKLEERHALIGKTTDLERLQYDLTAGRLKDLLPAEKEQLASRQAIIEASEKQYQVDEKYRKMLLDTEKSNSQDFSDRLFELDLIGKTAAEIEDLSIARAYDQKIMEAINDGASQQYIDGLRQQGEAAREAAAEVRRAAEEKGNDWFGGINDGLVRYSESFGTMRENISGLVVDSVGGMTDALNNFVTTGKGSFGDFTVSVMKDISKLMIKMLALWAIQKMVGMLGGGGASLNSSWTDASGGYTGVFAGGGYADGGYTGDGGKYEPAGIVHKGEYVLSQMDVHKLGGVGGIEGLLARVRKGYSSGGLVGGGARPALPAGGGMGNTQINITINRDGSSESDVQSDSEMGKQLAQVLPLMIEQWYVKNVARTGSPYYRSA